MHGVSVACRDGACAGAAGLPLVACRHCKLFMAFDQVGTSKRLMPRQRQLFAGIATQSV